MKFRPSIISRHMRRLFWKPKGSIVPSAPPKRVCDYHEATSTRNKSFGPDLFPDEAADANLSPTEENGAPSPKSTAPRLRGKCLDICAWGASNIPYKESAFEKECGKLQYGCTIRITIPLRGRVQVLPEKMNSPNSTEHLDQSSTWRAGGRTS